MTSLELARWQFGITTLYHFIFVPVTIGLATFIAFCQTRWYRTGDEHWLRATRFWGKLLLISFALGVATGIVQEFQFGMNWSDYSRFVGDIFGAPLAMEGLAAFFVESTFLGLWIFGWGRLSAGRAPRLRWAVAGSTALSAYFILAANSWMQHPVGYDMHAGRARADQHLRRPLQQHGHLRVRPHDARGAPHGRDARHRRLGLAHPPRQRGRGRVRRLDPARPADGGDRRLPAVLRRALRRRAHVQAAADEDVGRRRGLRDQGRCGLSLFATGDFKSNPEGLNRNVQIPNLLSWISTGYPRGEIKGVNDINREYRAKYGPGEYAPVIAVVYWTWRAMIASAVLMLLVGAWGWWRLRQGRLKRVPALPDLGGPAAILPFVGSLTGWTFTEMGRQPWAVFGLLKTHDAGSPSVEHGRGADQPGRVHAALRRARRRSPGASSCARRARDRSTEGTAEEPGQELALAY